MAETTWICCQLGAREHYAVPRALRRSGSLCGLITDAWAFGGRWHEEVGQATVTSFNWSLVAFETFARLRGLRGWPLIMVRNNWFQRKAVNALRDYRTTGLHDNLVSGQSSSGHVVLFSYSYAASDIFRFAKKHGWKTVLGQIDPGPVEEKIVAEEVACVPDLAGDWQPSPAKYWDNWQEECSLADHIIVNSEWSRAALEKGGVSGEKLSVIPLSYETGPRDHETTRPQERQYADRFDRRRPLRVLFLGQVNLRKGVARLFDAIRRLKNEPIEFQFVGRVQVAVPEDLKNNPRVRWLGTVPRGKTGDFYRAADVLIFPTLSDGFGLTQLEAQAYSLPVIASRNCGDIVKHGVNGLLLDEPTADAIIEALRFCLERPRQLAAFSSASRVEDRFSIDALGQNLLSLAGA